MMRDFSAARKPTGNTVPSAIGTSPKMSPGRRSPTTRSIPSTSLTGSMRPSSTAKSARSAPSWAAYSPGTRVMSAATLESRSRPSASRAAKTVTAPISSAVTMNDTVAAGERSTPHGSRSPARQKRLTDSRVQRWPRANNAIASRLFATGGGPGAALVVDCSPARFEESCPDGGSDGGRVRLRCDSSSPDGEASVRSDCDRRSSGRRVRSVCDREKCPHQAISASRP